MVGRVAVTGQYLMTDFKKQANIQMSPNDEGYVFILLDIAFRREPSSGDQ